MKTLVIDCATEACSVALFQGDDLLAGSFEMLGRGHAERLVPLIAQLPGRGQADRIAVSLGPGSFTGARIGLAAARALALAWGVPALGYPTLALIAAAAQQEAGARPLTVCTTGGHGQWFVQRFDARGLPEDDLASCEPADAIAACTSEWVAGSRASEMVEAMGRGTALALWPDARAFIHLPETLLQTALSPIYGRKPDAQLPAA